MPSLNRCLLMGFCTKTPELKTTPKGTSVAEMDIAINRVWKDDNGEKKEDTTFVSITAWGRTAEIISQYVTKGKPVFVEGRLQLDAWNDKETGQKRSRLRVVAENIQLLGSKENGGSNEYDQRPRAEQPRPQRRDTPPPVKRPMTGDPELDAEPDEIPF